MENREVEDVVFGKLLRALRDAKGYSQEKLGVEAGLTRNYISLLELGQKSPTLRTLVRLANSFDIPVSTMIAEFDTAYKAHLNQNN
jgi:transcriptional regulator with XRE-family HTH domain